MTKTTRLLKSLRRNAPEVRTPIASGLYLPNHSGDHTAGTQRRTPAKDTDLVNKAYVDSENTKDIKKDGSTTTTARIPFAQGIGVNDIKTLANGDALTITPLVKTTNVITNSAINITGINGVGTIDGSQINITAGDGGDEGETAGAGGDIEIIAGIGGDTTEDFLAKTNEGGSIKIAGGDGGDNSAAEEQGGDGGGISLQGGGGGPSQGSVDGIVKTGTTAVSIAGLSAFNDLLVGGGFEVLSFSVFQGNITHEGSLVTLKGDLFYNSAGSGIPFAEIYVKNNATATTITTQNVKVQVTIFTVNGASNQATPDHTNDHITILKSGLYFVSVSATIESLTGAGSKLSLDVYKNNGATAFNNLHADRDVSGGGGDVGSVSLNGIASLTINDTIEVWITNTTNTQNYTVEDITLNIFQVGGV